MITKKIINKIYRKYNAPVGEDIKPQLESVAEYLKGKHQIVLKNDIVELSDLSEDSPFRRIPIDRIYGLVNFEKAVAIVLPTCILFLSKENSNINIHIRLPKETIMEKIKNVFR